MEIFGKFKDLFKGGIACPACEGKGRIEKPKKGEYNVVFGTDPEKASVQELAAALLFVSSIALTDKLGVDPATIHVELKFGTTGHRVCFGLKREKDGPPGEWTHGTAER
jgi:hypothetical protein